MASSAHPEPAVRVPESFDREFPRASRRATETFLNIGLLVGGVRGAVESMVAAEGLPSMAAFNVLSVLAGDPEPLAPSVIAERMMVTRATTTGVLDSLETRRLIRRTSSATDGRARQVSITKAGKAIVERLVPRLHDFERDLMGALTDRELDQLLRLIARLQCQMATVAPATRLGIR